MQNRPLVNSRKRQECTPRQICQQKNKASIVSKEFYGLPTEFYGLQRFIELRIKNIKVAGTQNCVHTGRKCLCHKNPQKLIEY